MMLYILQTRLSNTIKTFYRQALSKKTPLLLTTKLEDHRENNFSQKDKKLTIYKIHTGFTNNVGF